MAFVLGAPPMLIASPLCSQQEFYGRPLLLADRDLVEQGADEILAGAGESDVALLVVGDPFGATTHTDFILRAKEKNIPYKVIHNASIMNAVGCCGLQLYKFGETVSIPYWDETWKPDSFYDKPGTRTPRRRSPCCYRCAANGPNGRAAPDRTVGSTGAAAARRIREAGASQ